MPTKCRGYFSLPVQPCILAWPYTSNVVRAEQSRAERGGEGTACEIEARGLRIGWPTFCLLLSAGRGVCCTALLLCGSLFNRNSHGTPAVMRCAFNGDVSQSSYPFLFCVCVCVCILSPWDQTTRLAAVHQCTRQESRKIPQM